MLLSPIADDGVVTNTKLSSITADDGVVASRKLSLTTADDDVVTSRKLSLPGGCKPNLMSGCWMNLPEG